MAWPAALATLLPLLLVAPSLLAPLEDALPAQETPRFARRGLTLAGPDETPRSYDVPFPTTARYEDGEVHLRAILPPDVAPRLGARLFEVSALAREGLLAPEGDVRVIVRGAAPGLLRDARELPAFGLVAGTVRYAELPALARAPGVARVDLDDVAKVSLDRSVPLVRADLVHAERDAEGRTVIGRGVRIAVLDTGIDYTHPDLGACLAPNPTCKVALGVDFVNADLDPMDDHGHGTHVAATAAGARGVAPGATLLAFKVCSAYGYCSYEHILAGLQAARLAGAHVVSISLGGPGTSDGPLATAVDVLVDAGVVVVSAAGNDGPAERSVGEPAASLKGIAVGASDASDRIAAFSSRGPVLDAAGRMTGLKPDLVAPGVDVVAAVPTTECRLCHASGKRALSGTSMATPHVSGAAALLLQAHPAWTPEEVKAALMGAARPLGLAPSAEGAGRLDAYAAWAARVAILPGNAFLGLDLNATPVHAASAAFRVRNLGDAPLELDLSARSDGLAARLDASALALGAREEATVTLTAEADNAALADGWWDGRILAQGDAATSARFSLLKTNVLRIRLDATASSLTLHGAQAWTSWYDASGVVTWYGPAGVYDLSAHFLDCPSPFGECDYEASPQRWHVVEGVALHGETEVALTPAAATNAFRTLGRTAEGVLADDAPACDEAPEGADCRLQWNMKLVRAGDPGFVIPGGWGANPTLYFSDLSPRWSVGRIVHYHAGGVLHRVQGATLGIAGNVTLDNPPESYLGYGVSHNFPPPHAAGHILDACLLAVRFEGAPAFYFDFNVAFLTDTPDDATLRYISSMPELPQVPLAFNASTSAGYCDAPAQYVYVGDWEELDLRGVGWTPYQRAAPSGVELLDFYAERPLDLRHARRGDAVRPFDGAPSLIAVVDARPDAVAFSGNTWFRPGGTGVQDYRASEGFHHRVLLDGEAVASGLTRRGGTFALPGEGRVRVELTTSQAFLDGANATVTHAMEYDAPAFTGKPPRLAWARVASESLFGTAFAEGAALDLRCLPQHPGGAAVVDVRARLLGEEGVIPLDAFMEGDLCAARASGLAPGAYGLDLEVGFADGTRAALRQSPAFLVLAGEP